MTHILLTMARRTVFLARYRMCGNGSKYNLCLCFTSLQQRGHLETAPPFTVPCEGRKLGKYTIPTGNPTPGRRVAVHYSTAAPR